MAVELPPLPFLKNDLEPYVSESTMNYHYEKHHRQYVTKLNKLISDTVMDHKTLEEIMFHSHKKMPKIYANAAQSWNHTFYWNCLKRPGRGPSKLLENSLRKSFGSYDSFREQFTREAQDFFGSGWIWLTREKDGFLKIRSMGNENNPLVEYGVTPLMTCDVWEHAYYLDYQNERERYLEAYWQVVNWDFVESNLNKGGEPLLWPFQYVS